MYGVGFKDYNATGVNFVSILFGIIYIIVNTLKNKNYRIIKNKLDVFVVAFLCICPILPLICNKYSSLEGTVTYAFKYISTLAIYLVVRDVSQDKKNIKLIINTLIFSGILLGILGIANIRQYQTYKWLEAKLGWPVVTEEGIMISSMGYKNSFAIYMGFILILTMNQIKETKNIVIKIIYIAISGFLIYCIVSAHSLIATILIISLGLIYIYVTSNNRKKLKKVAIVTLICLMIVIGILICIFKVVSKGDVYTYTGEETEYYNINNIKPNTSYTFKFKVKNNSINNYTILIRKLNRHNELEDTDTIEVLAGFSGTLEKTVQIEEGIRFLEIYFGNIKEEDVNIEVQSLLINDREFILKYKGLPSKVTQNINQLPYKWESMNARVMMIKAGIKLGMNSWVVGNGGNAWADSKDYVQDWVSNAKMIHSYPAEIFVEFGIIGVMAFIGIIINVCLVVKKEGNIQLNTLFIALLAILIHSIIDFDMTFLNILTSVFVVIAIISNRSETTLPSKIREILEIMIIICFIVGATITAIDTLYRKDINKEELGKILIYKNEIDIDKLNMQVIHKEYEEAIEQLRIISKKEKYKDLYEKYKWIEYNNVDEAHIQMVYEYVETHPFNIYYVHNRNRVDLISKIIKTTKNKVTDKFADLLISENDEMIKRINDYDANKLLIKEIPEKIKRQEKAYNQAIQYKEK